MLLVVITIAAIVSIVVVHAYPGTVDKCIQGMHHKEFPSPEVQDFESCFPWQNNSCCSAELTVNLKEHNFVDLAHFDLDYCGKISERCRKYMIGHACLFYCDPNMVKWQVSVGYTSKAPICSDTCDKWFEACKNDRTYSDNWMDEFVLHHSEKGPIGPGKPCKTFAKFFKNGEGMCNKIYGPTMVYERSSNCLVFDFEGENPNDNVVPFS